MAIGMISSFQVSDVVNWHDHLDAFLALGVLVTSVVQKKNWGR